MTITPIAEQNAAKRIGNFEEVNLGYSESEMLVEAKRCLLCKDARCIEKCPVSVDIPSFISKLIKKDYDSALNIIRQDNGLPGVCGRVCTHERQCEFGCILNLEGDTISISKLERYAADHGKVKKTKPVKRSKFRVAVVGSGPAGLSCALTLARSGHEVVIFEALHKAGGSLSYTIPEFRLPKKIVESEVKAMLDEGVDIKYNNIIGNTFRIAELQDQFDAVFLSCGAGLPLFMNISGEHLMNVDFASEFLLRVNLMIANEGSDKVAQILKGMKTMIIGCNSLALDAARTAKRLGSDVTIVFRRTLMEAPARQEDIRHAQEEGIQFMFLTAPKKLLGEKKVDGVELIQLMQTEEDTSGRRRYITLENSEFTMAADQIIVSLGHGPNQILLRDEGLEMDPNGKLVVDDDNMTQLDGVFAGGDLIEGEETMIRAMSDGKLTAKNINAYLKTKKT